MDAEEIEIRARRIRLLLTDCDGVLTDGSLYFGPDGESLKRFHIHDGLGFKLARQIGIKTGIISGRKSAALEARARELNVDYLYQGNDSKLAAYEEILTTEKLQETEVAYLGDDLPDLDLLRRVGLGVAVANAVAEVKAAAHYITKTPGGSGAFREVVDLILKTHSNLRFEI